MLNFWQKLNKPIFALAPMEEVTDFAFREMFAKYGKPDIMYTEFINVDGLTHPEGRKKLAIDLKYSEIQRPIVAQIWGRSPLKFEEAAKIIVDLGFDGIDINMGCPQDKEIGIGACAALIREPQLAIEIIKFTKKGADNLPVSVKTRIGYSKNELGTWLRHLLSAEPAAIALHARTKQDKTKVPANWEAIKEAVKIRDDFKSQALIIGNGDIKSRQEGLERIAQTSCDGIMVGRGAFGNPWFFKSDIGVVCPFMGDLEHPDADKSARYIPVNEKLRVMLEHAKLFQDTLGRDKSFFIMRKHFKAYCSGFDGAHELRVKLLQAKSLEEAGKIVQEYLTP